MLRSSLVNCLFHFLAHCLIAFETFSLPVPWPPLGLLSQTPGMDPGRPYWKEAQMQVEAVDGGRVFAGVGPPGVTYWVTSPGTWHLGLGCLPAFALRFALIDLIGPSVRPFPLSAGPRAAVHKRPSREAVRSSLPPLRRQLSASSGPCWRRPPPSFTLWSSRFVLSDRVVSLWTRSHSARTPPPREQCRRPGACSVPGLRRFC